MEFNESSSSADVNKLTPAKEGPSSTGCDCICKTGFPRPHDQQEYNITVPLQLLFCMLCNRLPIN